MLKLKDREEILKIIKTSSDARIIYRANVLNLRHKGYSASEIADILEITSRTVFNIQSNYEEGGLAKALNDDPRPGQPIKFDDNIVSHIVALVCSDPIIKFTENRKRESFAKFLSSLERKYAKANKITLVMDNLNTHSEKSLIEFYGEDEGKRIWNRFEVHYTPKHGSWLNQAEITINIYSRQCLGKTRIPDIQQLRKKTSAWSKAINRIKPTIKWTFTKRNARETFGYI